MLNIDLYCNDGSPLKVTPPDIYGRGVGGAELAMMSWAETMAGRGHQIRVYNNPNAVGFYNSVEYLPQAAFAPHDQRDVFIIFRSPNPFIKIATGYKIHWSTDQYTVGDFGRDIFPYVDKVVCISPFHVDYHKSRYQVDNGKIGYIDLGVRLGDYNAQEIEKVPGRCIYCSVPDRGLDVLRSVWPRIKERVDYASLVITADFRLWGAASPRNHKYRLEWLGLEDVTFLGKIERRRLVEEQQKAEVHPYPCIYDELFCISSAECQVAGAVSVTSEMGALRTTNEWGVRLAGNPASPAWQEEFVELVVEAIETEGPLPELGGPRKRFDWQRICEEWERLIEMGEFET